MSRSNTGEEREPLAHAINEERAGSLSRRAIITIIVGVALSLAVLGVVLGLVLGAQPEAPLRPDTQRIISAALSNTECMRRLAYMCDMFGSRLSGSPGLANAITWIYNQMLNDSFDNVTVEPVMVPTWIRGQEWAKIIAPQNRSLPMLGLGRSPSTNGSILQAQVIVVKSFAELAARSSEVRGKIVVFNAAWNVSYGSSVVYRTQGGITAQQYGAVAALVRSVTNYSLQTPHTGTTSSGTSIPTAAITIEDAELMQRMQDRNESIVIQLYMEAHFLNDSLSHNVVAEIKGSTHPEQIVVIGGHIDSWDPAQGAQDDGGGVLISWETLRLIKTLGLKPLRTIRVVMWTNEENGGQGASKYFQDHQNELNNTVAAMESDTGIFTPTSFGFLGSPAGFSYMQQVSALYLREIVGTNTMLTVFKGGGGADIDPLIKAGVPGLSIENAGWEGAAVYFNYHHTASDTVDKIDPLALQQSLAAFATVTYVLASTPSPVPRPDRKDVLQSVGYLTKKYSAGFGHFARFSVEPQL